MARMFNSRPENKKEKADDMMCHRLLLVVEMPGIEPGSEEFDREYTTGLVTRYVLAQMLPE